MGPEKSWFERLWSKDRRGADRCQNPPLIAHYWTGAPPSAQCIRDISSTGLFLQSEQSWYPGTVVRVTLQRTDGTAGRDPCCMTVQAMVVRIESGGTGFVFVMPAITRRNRRLENEYLVADRESLQRFVDKLKQKNIVARFDPWID